MFAAPASGLCHSRNDMPTPSVLEGVKAVRSQLGEAQSTPTEQVDAIKRQLETVLLDPEHKPHYESLRHKLREAYGSFVTDHPTLAAAMDSLATELSKAGL